jgi:hypothetical protein
MSFLPNDEERDWLGQSLRDMIRARGIAQFVATPILTPSDDDFPDPWDGSVRAAHRITQRLMHHAGIGALRISLTALPDDEAAPDDAWDAGTAGWFSGIEDGRARFGIQPKEIDDPDSVVGIMAHEVAHAWRQKHEQIDPDRDTEELLTDVTTVFLGFGILTTNATERYRSWRMLRATASKTKSMGYLPAPAMSWLLALQASARDDERELSAIRRYLEPSQKGWLDEAMEEIAADPRYLDALMLPPREKWPPRAARTPVRVVEPRSDEVREAPSPEERGETRRNAGQTAYRIESSRPSTRYFVGAWVGGIAGTVVMLVGMNTGLLHDSKSMLVVMAVAIGVGVLVGAWRQPLYRCSDVSCQAFVPRDAVVCPSCGSAFARTITAREWRGVQAEEIERAAAAIDFPDCADCQPEEPCAVHSGM